MNTHIDNEWILEEEKLFAEVGDDDVIEEEYAEFRAHIDFHMLTGDKVIEEGVLEAIKSVPSRLRKKLKFIKDVALKLGVAIGDLFKIFKNKVVFKFFTYIGWNMKRLFKGIKGGMALWSHMRKAFFEFVHKRGGKITKWTDALLQEFDNFLATHPIKKRLGGVTLGYLLVSIWLNMTFTGDLKYDFDQSMLFSAFKGSVGFFEVFSGSDGLELLTLFLTSQALELSFPWPGPGSVQLMLSVVGTLLIISGNRDTFLGLMKKMGINKPQQAIDKAKNSKLGQKLKGGRLDRAKDDLIEFGDLMVN